MKNLSHTISAHFARTIVAALQRKGLDHRPLLLDAGLNEQLIGKPGLRITPEQLSRLVQGVWRSADDELMGMGSQPSRYGVFSLMAKHVISCRNLRAVYHNLVHFYNLVTTAVRLELRTEGENVRLSVYLTEPDKDPDYTLRELLLLLLHRFPNWLIGRQIPLECVTFEIPSPAHYQEHRLMFPCRAEYEQAQCSLVFSAALLDEMVVQTPRTLSAHLRTLPLDWFKRQAYYPVYTRRVLDYLERNPDIATTNMEDAAAEMHMTSRTLRRKLDDEGTSFQELKDGIRRDAAIHYLSQPALPISQISRLLGFSEPAAFTRAFKQWTGVSPGLYRRS